MIARTWPEFVHNIVDQNQSGVLCPTLLHLCDQVMRKPDYYNIARLVGMRHLEYVSPQNATLLRDTAGNLADWNHVNFVGSVPIDISHLAVR